MKYLLLLLSSAVALASSASIQKRDPWAASIRAYFAAVELEAQTLKKSSTPPVCDFASASMPTTTSSPLPPPSENLSVYHVTVGRGTQNYTCSDPSAAPAAAGAVASLYNSSCVAGKFPSVLNAIPAAALAVPTPRGQSILFPGNLVLSGHHYFPDVTTPTFNLHTKASNYGIYFAKRVANTTAPADAPKGPDGAAAVPWLKLAVETPPEATSAADTAGNVQEIYRVNTAGGSAPKTCAGMPASFQVEYSAEYWFYAPRS